MLREYSSRLSRVQGVARCAVEVEGRVAGLSENLVPAAWLHDIGYAHSVAVTGFHALGGARWLRTNHWPDPVVSPVAYHSGAVVEAEERGLLSELGGFAEPDRVALDLLTWCDLTTSPTGSHIPIDDRIAEILGRYSSQDPVSRAVRRSSTELRDSVNRAERLLADVHVAVGDSASSMRWRMDGCMLSASRSAGLIHSTSLLSLLVRVSPPVNEAVKAIENSWRASPSSYAITVLGSVYRPVTRSISTS